MSQLALVLDTWKEHVWKTNIDQIENVTFLS